MDKKSVEGQPPVRLCNYTDVYYRDTIWPDQEFMTATATPEQIEAFGLLPGDVIITKDSETPDDIGVAAYVAGRSPDLICGYHLAVIRPHAARVDGRYLYWAMNSEPVRSQLSTAATGVTRFGLRADAIKAVRLKVPPLDEQRRIVEFLDASATRIDGLVQAKTRLLSLIVDRVDALLAIAIPRPGSPALAWPTKRLRFLASINEASLPEDTPSDTPIRYMDISRVAADGSRSEPQDLLFEDAPSRARRIARTGDTAISTVRTYLKAITFIDEAAGDFIWSTGFAIVSPLPEVLPKFLYYVARTPWFISEIQGRSVGISYPAITPEELGDMPCPLPAIDVQRKVVAQLDDAVRQARLFVTTSKRQIELLREHRHALISAAVGGELNPSSDRTAAVAT